MTVGMVTARGHIVAAHMLLSDDTLDPEHANNAALWRLQLALDALPSFRDADPAPLLFWLGAEGEEF